MWWRDEKGAETAVKTYTYPFLFEFCSLILSKQLGVEKPGNKDNTISFGWQCCCTNSWAFCRSMVVFSNPIGLWLCQPFYCFVPWPISILSAVYISHASTHNPIFFGQTVDKTWASCLSQHLKHTFPCHLPGPACIADCIFFLARFVSEVAKSSKDHLLLWDFFRLVLRIDEVQRV